MESDTTSDFVQYGTDNGQRVIYFHGVPGSTEECSLLDKAGKKHGLRILCLNRIAIDRSIDGDAYFKSLAANISRISSGEPVQVIGFSIGAFVAMQTCRFITSEVQSLHLISAAAPLEAGDFLASMAGKPMFQLAKQFPRLFELSAHCQWLLTLILPTTLLHLLFASVEGEDKPLLADCDFQTTIIRSLHAGFADHGYAYVRDINAYIHPWNAILADISIDTYIWHGALDNWTPALMANYLESVIPGCKSSTIYAGLSHYSCLLKAVNAIGDRLCKV